MSVSASPDQLLQRLEELGIDQTTYDHPAVFTVDESTDLQDKIPGGHSKNLFLKDKKGALFLIVAEQSTAIEMKTLHKVLNAARFSFANAERLMTHLGVTPGSVTPFAVINDPTGEVTVVLDAALMAHDIVNFHPLTNTRTTSIRSADLRRFLTESGHAPREVDFAAIYRDTPK
jgi:Ala-tRNA(Pro) deacylase